jgi:hypothetical protein
MVKDKWEFKNEDEEVTHNHWDVAESEMKRVVPANGRRRQDEPSTRKKQKKNENYCVSFFNFSFFGDFPKFISKR